MNCSECVWYNEIKQKNDDPYCLNLCGRSDRLPSGYVPIVACDYGMLTSRKFLKKDVDCPNFSFAGQLSLFEL